MRIEGGGQNEREGNKKKKKEGDGHREKGKK